MLKNHDPLNVPANPFPQFFLKPLPLPDFLIHDFLWMLNDARVEHDSLHRSIAETVVVLAESLPVSCQAFRRGNITDVMIACNAVERNASIKFMRDTQILFDLCLIPRFVYEISAHDNEGRVEAIRGRDCELQVSAFLFKADICGVHAKLWV